MNNFSEIRIFLYKLKVVEIYSILVGLTQELHNRCMMFCTLIILIVQNQIWLIKFLLLLRYNFFVYLNDRQCDEYFWQGSVHNYLHMFIYVGHNVDFQEIVIIIYIGH